MSRAEGEQASSLNKGFVYYYGSLQICEQQSVFPLVSTHYKDERRKLLTIFTNVIFAEVFAEIVRKKARTRFRLHTKLSSLLKFFQNTI